MRKSIALLWVAIGLAVGGCATQAEQQSSRIESELSAVAAGSAACWRTAVASDDFRSLGGKFPAPGADTPPSVAMMADTSRPTADEARRLVAFHREQIAHCQQVTIDGLAAIHPALQSAIARGYLEYDAAYVQLVTGRTTWGDFAGTVARLRQEGVTRWNDAARQIQANLQDAHRYEIQQRQAAAMAFQQWQYQQQVISAMNRPVNTSCYRTGAFLNCTSQ